MKPMVRVSVVLALAGTVMGSSVAQASTEATQVAAATGIPDTLEAAPVGFGEVEPAQSTPAPAPASKQAHKHGKIVAIVIVAGLLLFVIFAAIDLRHA